MKNSTNQKILKSEQTKQRIMDGYLDLILDKKWDKITVKEICSCAGITRGTFYQYFNDIYDLMEQIEIPLLEDISKRYQSYPKSIPASFPAELFDEKFDYTPPISILNWFDFCKDHKKKMRVLLGSNGDSYFISKLRTILGKEIDYIMDADAMPRDGLRCHFNKIFLELHFMAARSWLEARDDDLLSVESIINLLNTMRVGANYLTYKRMISPEFDMKMSIPEEKHLG